MISVILNEVNEEEEDVYKNILQILLSATDTNNKQAMCMNPNKQGNTPAMIAAESPEVLKMLEMSVHNF